MKAPLIALLLAVSLSGCQAASLTGAKTGTTASAIRLGNLQFQPASAATMSRLSSQASGSANATAAAPAAPQAAGDVREGGAAPSVAIAPSPYSFGTYFGGPFGQMKLDSVTEATAAAVAGGFLDAQTNVVGPAVADWAADARLLGSNGTLDEAGNPVAGTENYPGELAWHATYASVSRSEVLEFQVGASGTKVVRMHWTPVTIDAAAVKVDAKAAVETLAKAVVSRLRSKEEELGHDYFFNENTSANVGVGVAVPAIAVAPGMPAPDVYQGPTTETLYRLKAGGRWSVNLQAIGDHLVWELSYNPNVAIVSPGMDAAVSSPAMPATAPRAVMQATTTSAPVTAVPVMAPAPDYQPQPWTDENAYGMVDAKTGEVIRLRRPTSYTYPTGGVKPNTGTSVNPNTGTAVQGSAGGSTGSTPNGKL